MGEVSDPGHDGIHDPASQASTTLTTDLKLFFGARSEFRSVTSRRSDVVSGTVLVALLEIVGNGLRYLQQVALARLAGPTAFGVYTLANSSTALLGIPVGLGLSAAAIRFVAIYRAEGQWGRLRGLVRRSTQITLWTGVLVAGLAAVTVAAIPVHRNYLVTILLALALIPVVQIATLQEALLRGCGRLFSSRVVPNVLQPVLVVVAAVGLRVATGRLTASGILVGVGVGAFIGIAFQTASLRRPMAPADVPGVRREYEIRRWMHVARPLLLVQGFQAVLSSSDILLVGLLIGAEDAGIYGVASRTAALAALLATAVNLAASPSIALSQARNDRLALEEILRRSVRTAFWLSLLVSLLMITLAPRILSLFGPRFSTAGISLIIMICGWLFVAATGPMSMVLGITGHERASARIYGAAAVTQFALDLVLIPPFGVAGAAIAATATLIGLQSAQWIVTVRLLRVRLWPLPGSMSAHPSGQP